MRQRLETLEEYSSPRRSKFLANSNKPDQLSTRRSKFCNDISDAQSDDYAVVPDSPQKRQIISKQEASSRRPGRKGAPSHLALTPDREITSGMNQMPNNISKMGSRTPLIHPRQLEASPDRYQNYPPRNPLQGLDWDKARPLIPHIQLAKREQEASNSNINNSDDVNISPKTFDNRIPTR